MTSKISLCFFHALVAALSGIAFYFYVAHPALTWFNCHMSRDFVRGLDWLHGRPEDWLGPEIFSGTDARLPGPMFYWLLAALLSLTQNLSSVLILKSILTFLGISLFSLFLARRIGFFFAALFFLSFILYPTQLLLTRTLWNPSVIVLVNVLLFVCTVRFLECGKYRFFALLHLAAFIGAQVHMSTLMGYVSCILAIAICGKLRGRNILAPFVFFLFPLITVYTAKIGTWYMRIEGAPYGFEFVNLSGFCQLYRYVSYHFYFDLSPLADYDIHGLFADITRTLWPEQFAWLSIFAKGTWVNIPLCVVSTIWLLSQKEDRKTPHVVLSVFWLWFCSFLLIFYTGKHGVIPYRYGYSFYPLQFLVPALGVASMWSLLRARGNYLGARIVRDVFVFIVLSSFFLFAFYLIKTQQVMTLAGRTFHVSKDSYELPLSLKSNVLRWALAQSRAGEDPYFYIHGAIANKIRLNDMNWFELPQYLGLQNAIERANPDIRKGLGEHLWIESINWNQRNFVFENAQQHRLPLIVRRVPPSAFPQHCELRYFDADGKLLHHMSLSYDQMLFPLNIPEIQDVQTFTVTLFFDAAAIRSSKNLRIVYDFSDYRELLQLTAAKQSDQTLNFRTSEKAGFLAQSEAIIPSLADNVGPIELTFSVNAKIPLLARLEFFLTPDDLFWSERNEVPADALSNEELLKFSGAEETQHAQAVVSQ